ncbi:MAG TPA: hypothetical protein VNE58_15345 [Casimicrobiaceae bacterium]|nr:hypothetical protein [Casimicrobiaceae bacterium]
MRFSLVAVAFLVAQAVHAQGGFRFSQPDEADRAERAEREAKAADVADALSAPCRADLKNKKIMVVIGESLASGQVVTEQRNFGPHYDAINNRLRRLGLKTYTPEEIRRQVAQAEIDAQFRNDPDAALSAAKRLGASFVLKGLIASQANRNPMMRVNQVSVSMGFALTGSNGQLISTVDSSDASYAGANVSQAALALVNEQADAVVARLYTDYCRKAAPPSPAKKR